jgi:hypothetical protein
LHDGVVELYCQTTAPRKNVILCERCQPPQRGQQPQKFSKLTKEETGSNRVKRGDKSTESLPQDNKLPIRTPLSVSSLCLLRFFAADLKEYYPRSSQEAFVASRQMAQTLPVNDLPGERCSTFKRAGMVGNEEKTGSTSEGTGCPRKIYADV